MDIAKAVGILVVLVVHTGVGLGPFTFFGGMFYMPIFFVLAGMTFRFRPEESFAGFVKKKAGFWSPTLAITSFCFSSFS